MYLNKNTYTQFPNSIDARNYYSDVNIDDYEKVIEYQNLIASNQYQEAAKLANDMRSLNYGAWTFERFTKRILAIRNYAQNNMDDSKPSLTAYQNTEPNISDYDDNFAWISSS